MRLIAIILSVVIFGQSLSVCGPEIAYHRDALLLVHEGCNHNTASSMNACHVTEDTEKSVGAHGCCAATKSKNHNTSDSSDDEKDCCGDSCHCFCCAKILLNNAPRSSALAGIPAGMPDEPCTLIKVHSFDFHPSISNPPQHSYLS